MTQAPARAWPLLPLLFFMAVFFGSGIYYSLQGTEFAFYQIKAPVVAMAAIVLACVLARQALGAERAWEVDPAYPAHGVTATGAGSDRSEPIDGRPAGLSVAASRPCPSKSAPACPVAKSRSTGAVAHSRRSIAPESFDPPPT